MSRKLASIQRVYNITPIDGADRIELAHVLGWQCVTAKGSFKPGDLGVYFEIDSFIPVRPEFEFLRATCFKESPILGPGFRLRTQRFKGQLSQGLLMPLSAFPEIPEEEVAVGQDVSKILGVRKWEIEERATTGGTVIGSLPPEIPHTDETRIQAMPELLEAFRGKDYYITTKMDGSSHSISIDEEGCFHVTGHNYEYKDDEASSFYRFVKKRGFHSAMEQYMKEHDIKSLVLQGEFCGPGIQRNRLKLTRPEWYIFTVLIDGKRVGLPKMRKVTASIGAAMVPVEEVGTDLPSVYPSLNDLLHRAGGSYPNGGPKEGIVIRTVDPEFCNLLGEELSIKVINNKYLLKKN